MTTIDTNTTAVSVVESSDVSLPETLHMGMHFASIARRAASAGTPHKITWFTGNNKCKDAATGKALPDIAGWAIECPDLEECGLVEDYELYDAMTLLCNQGKAVEVIVQHQDEAGKPRYVRYWALEQASLFVVCEGVPSKAEMYKDVQCRWGVAWAPMANGRRSSIQFVAFIMELMDNGYNYPFHFRISSYCSDRMLAALYAHVRVLDFADRLREQAGETTPTAYYAYALTTMVSQRTLTAGKEVGKTTEIYYPVPQIPQKLSADFLASVAITDVQAAFLEDGDRVADTVAWSVEKSARLINGDEQPGDAAPDDPNVPF